MKPEFRTTRLTHPDCAKCLDRADYAVTMALVTGSVGAKMIDTRLDATGTTVEEHGAEVTRL